MTKHIFKPTTDEEIYEFLKATGHLEYPNGKKQDVPTGPFSQAIKTAAGMAAIASFQEMEAEKLERACLKHHKEPAHFDGVIGPATIEVMGLPRCGHPDYGPDVEAAVGNGGSWVGCHDIGDAHCATIYVDESGIPSFLEPVYSSVLERIQAAYDDIGLRYTWVESPSEANITVEFVRSAPGWIGLAIVGQREACTSKIWAKFLGTYKPANVLNEWTTLMLHEHGHNAGLSHSRGGIMNPSIVEGLAPTWRGDPSEPLLVRMYGGEPVGGGGGDGQELWTHSGIKSNKGREVWVPLAVPYPVED